MYIPQKVAGLLGSGYAPKRMNKRKKSHLLHCCALPAWWPSAKRSDPIPSRTRPSNASAPMVLCLKTWESRSSPGLQCTTMLFTDMHKKISRTNTRSTRASPRGFFAFGLARSRGCYTEIALAVAACARNAAMFRAYSAGPPLKTAVPATSVSAPASTIAAIVDEETPPST